MEVVDVYVEGAAGPVGDAVGEVLVARALFGGGRVLVGFAVRVEGGGELGVGLVVGEWGGVGVEVWVGHGKGGGGGYFQNCFGWMDGRVEDFFPVSLGFRPENWGWVFHFSGPWN